MKVRFSLPIADCPARLSVTSDGTLSEKDYVLKISFPGVSLTQRETVDLKLFYSESFESAFLYSPIQQNGDSGMTRFFRLPEGASRMEVTVERWRKSAELASIESIRLNAIAPWKTFNHLTVNGVEVDG